MAVRLEKEIGVMPMMVLSRLARLPHVGSLLLASGLALYAAAEHALQPSVLDAMRPADGQPDGQSSGPALRGRPGSPAPQGRNADVTERGLLTQTDAACAGYTLFAPLNSTTTYLVDLRGKLVHSRPSKYVPGQAVYLLDDGSILRCAREPANRHFEGGGIGGRVERIAPDGTLMWEFVYADENHCQHHDIEPLPNGHILLIAWEKKTRDEAVAAGADPERLTGDEIWPDCVLEVAPSGPTSGKIVWEWHVRDHLIQEFDPSKPTHGVVADHPELVDLNYPRSGPAPTAEDIERLRAPGLHRRRPTRGVG